MKGNRLPRKEIAPLLGITTQRLGQLIREGKITEHENGIDPEQAKREYALNTDAAKREAHRSRSHFLSVVEGGKPAEAAAEPVSHVKDPETGADLFSFNNAKAQKEHYHAQRAKLEFEKASGALLQRDAVVAREFEVARKLRDRLLGLPARLANFVPADAMKVVTDEVDALIREMQQDAADVVSKAS